MITSTANAQVKELVRLMKKSRARDEAGVFLVEGPRMAGELMEDTAWSPEIEKIYLSESYAGKHKNELSVIESRAGMEILSDAVFAHVSDTKTPQGILAVVKRKAYRMDDILGGNPSAAHILVLDRNMEQLYSILAVDAEEGTYGKLYVNDTFLRCRIQSSTKDSWCSRDRQWST